MGDKDATRAALLRLLVGDVNRADVVAVMRDNAQYVLSEESEVHRAELCRSTTPAAFLVVLNRGPGVLPKQRATMDQIAVYAQAMDVTWGDLGFAADGSVIG